MKKIPPYLRPIKITLVILFMSFSGYAQPPFVTFFGDTMDCHPYDIVPFQDTSLFHAGVVRVPGGELG